MGPIKPLTPKFSRPLPQLIGLLALGLAQLGLALAAEPTASTDTPARRPALRGEKNLGPFSIFDTDHDGTLSPAEIAAAAKVLLQFDKNHDGSLTAAELPKRRPAPPRDHHPNDNDDGPGPPPP